MEIVTASTETGRASVTSCERILVCLRYGIGDVVMELPALRALRSTYPHAHIAALGAWPALELLTGDPLFDHLASVQSFGFAHWGDDGNVRARLRLTQWCDESAFDCLIDIAHAPIGVRDTLAALGIPFRNTGSNIGDAAGGALAIWRSAVAAWQLPDMAMPAPALHIDTHARALATQYFVEHGLDTTRTIAIAPVASSALKRWPLPQVGALMQRLMRDDGWHMLLFGIESADHEALTTLTAALPPHVYHHVEPCHLQQTAALIARCRAFLGNDTGLAHISAAVGTPTVAVFGATSPHVALPIGARAITSGLSCPHRLEDRFGPPACVQAERCLLDDQPCIARVRVDEVAAALSTVLSTAAVTRRAPDSDGH
jgi:ADP-heptose:LPS heptosyltransferase